MPNILESFEHEPQLDRDSWTLPGWFRRSFLGVIALVLFGVWIGRKMETLETQMTMLDVRMCRLEAAQHVPLWYTCNGGRAENNTALHALAGR